MYDDEPTAWGIVVDDDRGSLPYSLIHGEALVAAAAWALGAAEVTLLDASVPWSAVREGEQALVLHDSLCPLTPPEFIASCVARSLAEDVVVVGVRPVTDTVKEISEDGFVGRTLDREALAAVCSPIVLPPRVVAELEALPSLDFPVLVHALRARTDVLLVPAPPEAARVTSADDVRSLEAGTALPQQS
ncbi:2-C-methyl-D-erythritol 4-phosphate cytidylyltransferase [Nocardioides sp. GXZ039]|uniref:2-C-methyl-D-erythritol 4-phosphate cytidylyltransferase n=1 Tax=Nocardioides sp. GXZ039 TaxID=3136018 RepID=UPI0030F419EC